MLERLTRIRLQLAIYFWLHRGKDPAKGCKIGSPISPAIKKNGLL